jgi:hypothetical protein
MTRGSECFLMRGEERIKNPSPVPSPKRGGEHSAGGFGSKSDAFEP